MTSQHSNAYIELDNRDTKHSDQVPSSDFANVNDVNSRINKKRKKKKKPRGNHNKVAKIILIILGCIVGLAIICGLIAFAFISSGKQLLINSNVVVDDGKVVYYNDEKYVFNENIISTLIIGFDLNGDDYYKGKSGQSDFLLLLTLDTSTGKMANISIPRDTMVNLDEYVGQAYIGNDKKEQICFAYSYGDGKHTSCENTVTAVSRLLYNMPVVNYLSLNLEGIGPINDSIGGVYLTPIETIPHTSIVKGEPINLIGKNAQRYVQYRDSYSVESSERRRQRQVQYVNEFYKQAFGSVANDLTSAITLFNIARQYSYTNLGIPEFSYLAQIVLTHGFGTFQTSVIPGNTVMGQNYVEYYPDETKTYELVLNTFYCKE